MKKSLFALLAISLILYGCLGSKSGNAESEFQKLEQYKTFQEQNPNSTITALFISKAQLADLKQYSDCRGQLPDEDYYQLTAKSASKQLLAFAEYRSAKIACVLEQDTNSTPTATATPKPIATPSATDATQTQQNFQDAATPTPAQTATPAPTQAAQTTATPTPLPTPYSGPSCSDGTPVGKCSAKTKPYFCAPESPPTLIKIESKCA